MRIRFARSLSFNCVGIRQVRFQHGIKYSATSKDPAWSDRSVPSFRHSLVLRGFCHISASRGLFTWIMLDAGSVAAIKLPLLSQALSELADLKLVVTASSEHFFSKDKVVCSDVDIFTVSTHP